MLKNFYDEIEDMMFEEESRPREQQKCENPDCGAFDMWLYEHTGLRKCHTCNHEFVYKLRDGKFQAIDVTD